MLKDDLATHLRKIGPAPFLFVGAGLSRRYLEVPSWEGLLRHFAGVVGENYNYLYATAEGDLPRVASLIAKALHEPWWKSEEFAESRAAFPALVGSASALKAEVARYVTSPEFSLTTDPKLLAEFDLLRAAVVDGVITTNYDALTESAFGDFKVFVGEEGLLFSDVQGVGEIYKIHGDHREPDSLILTAEDYEEFNERRPYLAAKLLTIFVERPIIFLGYSMSDTNILDVIRSIATALTKDRVSELQDRLIFVEWDPALASKEPRLTATSITAEGGFTIPVQHVRVSDFTEVFEALGTLERRFPARYLRHLKEHVYELVRTNEASAKMHVIDFDPSMDLSQVEVVLGVGAIERLVPSYKSVGREELLRDVLLEDHELDAVRVLKEVLPSFPHATTVPVFKYLRGAGFLDDEGKLADVDVLDGRLVERYDGGWGKFASTPASVAKAGNKLAKAGKSFDDLVASDEEPYKVLALAHSLPENMIDRDSLRSFLVEHTEALLNGHPLMKTQWAKGVCMYDWLRWRRK